jgi:PilZ domain
MAQLTKKRANFGKERAVRRCAFVASAEVTEPGSGTRLSGRISELGMGGCYVDALNPFPKHAVLQVKILRDQGAFEAEARVAYCDPTFGMGLAFTHMTPEHRAVLEGWLVELVMLLRPEA